MTFTRIALAALVVTAAPAWAHEKAHHDQPAGSVKKEQKDWGIAGDRQAARRIIQVTMTAST
jgi:invasion protein IalB